MAVGRIQLLVVVELIVYFLLAVEHRPPPVPCLVAFLIDSSQCGSLLLQSQQECYLLQCAGGSFM